MNFFALFKELTQLPTNEVIAKLENLESLMQVHDNKYVSLKEAIKIHDIEFDGKVAFDGLNKVINLRKEYCINITGNIKPPAKKILFRLVDDQENSFFSHYHIDELDGKFHLTNIEEKVKFTEIDYFKIRLQMFKDTEFISQSEPFEIKVIKELTTKERFLSPLPFLWGFCEPIAFLIMLIIDFISIFTENNLYRIIVYSITVGIIILIYITRIFTKRIEEPPSKESTK